ncbi:MAG: hypothetical protein DMG40_05405 [Acidobacteria bacterium]|nr:MAG: hypothetical protein DMG40_05405 [Acidobacteriota bacterium]
MLLSLKRLQRILVAKVVTHWWVERNQGQSFRTICGGISRPRVAVRDVETAFFSLSVFET